jgi:membrane protease YdiL (CAAX protease family)
MRWNGLRAAAAELSGAPWWLVLAGAAGVMPALALAGAGQEVQRLVLLLVLAPLIEEVVFRAGLQEALLYRWHRVPGLANAATATVFGLAHALVRTDAAAVVVALPALLIGAVYQRTGRLRHCVVLHAAMNAIWLGWSMTGAVLPGFR